MKSRLRLRLRLAASFGARTGYLAGAVLLTLVWLLARALAPEVGLIRSFYPLPRQANPLSLDVAGLPAMTEAAAGVDLAFLDEPGRLTRDYFVRWHGVWFSPRAERIDLWAGADDGVVVRLDGDVVHARHPGVGMHSVPRTLDLAAGSHDLEIDHWQRGGGRGLTVRWGPPGGEPAPLAPGRLFPADPGALGYGLRAAADRLPPVVLLVWAAGPAVLLGAWVRRRLASLTAAEAGARLRAAALPALLVPSQVLLFGPWTVHATNRGEFLAPFWSFAPRWLWLLALVAGLLAAAGLPLSTRGFRRYVAALCAAGVLLWAQGNLLVADYGLLDGGGLDLAAHAWRGPLEAGLWIAVLALAVAFAARVARAAPTASAMLMAPQAAVLLLPPLAPAQGDSMPPDAAETWRLPPAEIYELSAGRNLIHVVLDMFPTYMFEELREEDRPAFDRAWSGFTLYRDHLGAFRTTKGSMPAMLTGVAYRNETPFRRFARRRPTVFHALGQEGWRLRSLTAYVPDHPSTTRFPGAESVVRYSVPAPYGTYRDYVVSVSAQLLDLSLFRHAPHGAKAAVYREGDWLVRSRMAADRGTAAAPRRPFGDAAFLRELAERATAAGDDPVYTFVHLITPHPPLITDAECSYLGRRLPLTPRNYLAQATCALRAVRSLLDRLRQLDLYDSSAIVVTSDHGTSMFPNGDSPLAPFGSPAGASLHELELNATPLLLVKPFGAQGPLRTSYAPTAITDVPATLLDLAGLPNVLEAGTSVLRLETDRPRERTYAHHSWGGRSPNTFANPWFDVLHLFTVGGRVTDPGSWRYRRAVFEPTDRPAAQRGAHRVGLWEHASGAPSDRPTWWTGDYAAFFVPADTGRAAFNVRKAPDLAAQTVTVRIDGQVVGRHSLADDAWRTLEYALPARDEDASPYCVELLVGPLSRDDGDRARGVLVRGDL